MFKNLRTSTKLIVLCSIFVISLGVTTYGLVAEKWIAIHFAQKELIGNQYLATLRGIYAAILTERASSASVVQPSTSADELLTALASAESIGAGVLQTTDLVHAFAATLRELWTSKVDDDKFDVFLMDALGKLRKLVSRIGDDSNLALDPDLDTYYLQNVVVGKLPTLLGKLGETQTLLREATTAQVILSDRKTRLLILDGLIRSTADEVKDDLAAAYRGNLDGRLQLTIDAEFAAMISSTEAYLDGLKRSVADAEAKGSDHVARDRLYATAVGAAIKAWAIAQTELDRLLQHRIDGLAGKLSGSLILIGALSTLSILIAVMTHRHIVRPLERLEDFSAAVRKTKNYDLRIDYSSHDEIGRLAGAFNNMLSELAAAREREMAKQSELARITRLTTVGAMTASIAHEINQPLAAIAANGSAGLRWLANTTPDLDEARAALNRIVSDSHRASRVIGSIRAMFKGNGDERMRLGINDLILEVLSLVQSELQKQRVSVETELLPRLPPVVADRVQLQQVLLNLIINAIEAMDSVTHGARVLSVKTAIHEQSGVLITVKDSGAGIDPQIIDRIFDAFFTTKSRGMGMGLSICRSIIEAHNGRLWASPGVDRGSVFQIVLPTGEPGGG